RRLQMLLTRQPVRTKLPNRDFPSHRMNELTSGLFVLSFVQPLLSFTLRFEPALRGLLTIRRPILHHVPLTGLQLIRLNRRHDPPPSSCSLKPTEAHENQAHEFLVNSGLRQGLVPLSHKYQLRHKPREALYPWSRSRPCQQQSDAKEPHSRPS